MSKIGVIFRWLFRALLLVAGLIVLTAAWLMADAWRGRHDWEAYRAKAVARGVKMTFADYLPPTVPPEEDFAELPIFRAAAQKDSVNSGSGELIRLLSKIRRQKRLSLSDEMRATSEVMVKAGWLRGEDVLPDAPAQAVLLGLRRFEPVFTELRAARYRPHARFTKNPKPPLDTDFYYAHVMLDLHRQWLLRTEAHLVAGESAAAFEDFLDVLRLYEALCGEPSLWVGLARTALLVRTRESIQKGLVERLWSDADLTALTTRLDKIELGNDASWALESERGFHNDAAEEDRRTSFWERVRQNSQNPFGEDVLSDWWGSLQIGQKFRVQRAFNQLIDLHVPQIKPGIGHIQLIDLLQGPQIKDGRPMPVATAGAKPWPAIDSLARNDENVIEAILQRYAALEVSLRQTRIVCGLERFRLRHGGYPATLAELEPEFLTNIPRDLIDDQPMRYRPIEPDAFLLYSIGRNGVDDGGAAEPRGRNKNSSKAPDWVWGKDWR